MKFRLLICCFVFSILILILAQIPVFIICIIIAIFLAIFITGIFDIRQNFFVKSFLNKRTSRKIVALTFDDGPTEFTPEFLKLLEKFNAKATFFCIGKQVDKHPEIFRQILKNGHSIGNHTFSHSNKTGFFTTKKMESEILECDKIMQETANIKTNFYRPPFGVTNPHIAKAIKKTNKISIGWNVRSLDTVLKNEYEIAERILRKTKPGSVILMHDTSEKSYRALELLLLNLQQQNYRFLTVDELINFKE